MEETPKPKPEEATRVTLAIASDDFYAGYERGYRAALVHLALSAFLAMCVLRIVGSFEE